MWPFTKKNSLEQSGLFKGLTDWHSHIQPGVDDGFQKMEDSLAALKKYEELGVKSVWLTPHIMEECRNTTQGLRDRFAELQAEYQGPIQLQLAAENMLDSLFEERFQANDLLTIGPDGKYLLVETSYVNPPFGMEQMMQNIISRSCLLRIPVLVFRMKHKAASLNGSTGLISRIHGQPAVPVLACRLSNMRQQSAVPVSR